MNPPARSLPEQVTVRLGLDEPDDESHLRHRVARMLGVDELALPVLSVHKRAIDARQGRVRFSIVVRLGAETERAVGPLPRDVTRPERVLVVGDGPAGLFCAYQLARQGVGCTVLDRGKKVQPRRHDLKALYRDGSVNADSNYCYGEGGAGTYSDGKLYTRSNKRGNVEDVLQILALHGAPPAILTDARPHVGSNRLPKVVTALRERLESRGVVFRFGARVAALLVERTQGLRSVAGVQLSDGSEMPAECVVLATGHSARDVFEMLGRAGVGLEPKPFSVGVRIEHPQVLIDRVQYGSAAGHPRLPPASYQLAATIDGRGVFSFCMCPGGFIVPAATEPEGLVLNGMSLAKRDSVFANSGLVVSITPEDLTAAGYTGPLGGVQFQSCLERAASAAGGGRLRAPGTRATDFLARRGSSTLPPSSYMPGLAPCDLAAVLDAGGLALAGRLREGLSVFAKRMRGFASERAVLVAVESRTSSPVRVPRDASTWQTCGLCRLFVCGEGAGYAGGIVSSALDGIGVAERIAAVLR
ncbi:MAG: NAD(P)/FAD-dependent oxidoreductase [Polyangiaceae bacterium]|nr:NAD(P)/FAD-dependent oxidoreductase [Polyangiaceae bacterium]